ncbi:U3 small nucleolar RNA-associated protein 6-like protein [Iris pallida]|uniref:U3 small nucleolar RNA-associated protein 6-like protein n=1 Tax=Iris pallida TaxID=29817 RepID=A0AAX6FIF1_IRIPA|nr:U3 small nucleolar RNA-associated protein 6-like protein [Iris pallida]KAJ6829593.1 U3 small nucleolar RNA-associated protein 6-like protein [Iris pallida]
MADVVQFRLERLADELDDLHSRGLFTRPELARIVSRRRDFEYRLKRPSPLKSDFLLYVEYEQQIDRLRDLRKRRIIGQTEEEEEEEEEGEKRKKRKRGKKWKKSISDVAGVMRILDVYRMAAARYKGDLDLWFRYLEFCRERKHGRMKKVLAQALKFHPKVPGLWIYAAAWEFDQNLNVASARNLMWSGLRACPQSEDLWVEYLRMELTYLNKLKARKVALGEDVKTLERGNPEVEQWKEENKDLFMSLNDEEEEPEGANQNEGNLEKNDNPFLQQGSAILQTIYHGAVEAMPSSMSLRKQFLEVLDSVDLAQSDDLRKEVMEDFRRDFSHDELYWDWRARLQILDTKKEEDEILSKLNKAVEVYEEALHVLPSVKMFSLYAKFWLDVFATDKDNSSSLVRNIKVDATEFTSYVVKVYERAEANGCLTEDLACQYVSFYLQIGRIEEARNLARKLCNGKQSQSANLWLLRVSIELKWSASEAAPMKKDGLHSIFELLKNALTRLSVSKAENLWIMALKNFASDKEHFEKLVKILMTALVKDSGSDSGFSVALAVAKCILQSDGIRHAREMYKRFLALPHPSLAFFRTCIELESSFAVVGENEGIANARKLYESALSIYGENRELWKDYYTIEMKIGTSETANAVYWRARKALKDATGLSVT